MMPIPTLAGLLEEARTVGPLPVSYQIAKSAGALAAALEARPDAVLLTGGMAHLAPLVEGVRRRVTWIASVHVLPGENELGAFSEGALGVLRGEEQARR